MKKLLLLLFLPLLISGCIGYSDYTKDGGSSFITYIKDDDIRYLARVVDGDSSFITYIKDDDIRYLARVVDESNHIKEDIEA